MNRHPFQRLIAPQWERKKYICVGLDPDLEKLPPSVLNADPCNTITAFNRAIIDATKDLVCAYKPNTAFYEAYGEEGWRALRNTIDYVHDVAPDVPVILDAKRADIGNTNRGYARAFFDELGVDAVTVHPYVGREALLPFLERADKGIFVLCRTSNEGAGEFQDLKVAGIPLHHIVAQHVAAEWNANKNCGLVAGATHPEELSAIRMIAGDMPILIPGVGAQGGDIRDAYDAGARPDGGGAIVSVSRSVLYASGEPDFASAPRDELLQLHKKLS